MPRRHKAPPKSTETFMLNCSFESQCATWFMQGGWEVFVPLLDHGHKTDLLVSDGPSYYRIQIKTLASASRKSEVTNLWKGSNLDYVIYFAKSSSWGCMIPAFETKRKKLSAAGAQHFNLNSRSFLKAFHALA